MRSVSVVIVTRNRREEVLALLGDLAPHAQPGDSIAVVDNGSSDQTPAVIRREFPGVHVIEQTANTGAPAARNAGAAATAGEILVFLDDDVRVHDPEFLGRVRAAFGTLPEAGVIAFGILDPGTGRPRRFEIPTRRKDRWEDPVETSWFISAGCAIHRRVYGDLGGMDASLGYGFEELEFSYRALGRGHRIFYRPEIRVHHRLSGAGRPAGRRVRCFYRNKIRISLRYLPWRMVLAQLVVWSGYFLVESFRAGRPDAFLHGLISGIAHAPESLRRRRSDRLSPEAVRRLARLEGRLYT
jgi:hypothetical protein